MMTMVTKRKNPNWLKDVKKRQGKLISQSVAIGFPLGTDGVSAQYPDGTSILDVAVKNNFGDGNIPRRDFMTAGLKNAVKKTLPISRRFIDDINSGKTTAKKVLNLMGLSGASQIQLAIRDLKTPPNTRFTIESKGSSNPLVDTGLMMQTVTHIVRDS